MTTNNYSPVVNAALDLMKQEGVMYRIETKNDRYYLYIFDKDEEWYWRCAMMFDDQKPTKERLKWYTDHYKQELHWTDDDLTLVEHEGKYYFKRNLLHLSQSLCGPGLDGIIHWFMVTSHRKNFNEFAMKNFGAPVKNKSELLFKVYRAPCTEDYKYYPPLYRAKKLWYPSLDLFETGFVVGIEGQNYEVRWPGFSKLEYAPWDRPDLFNELIMKPTNKPQTKPVEKGEFYVWGRGRFQQSSPKVKFNKQEAYQFINIPDWHDQDFTSNLLIAIDKKKPARIWFEGSCT